MHKTLEKKIKKRMICILDGKFDKAKEIEDELAMFNVILEDTKEGTRWNFKALFL